MAGINLCALPTPELKAKLQVFSRLRMRLSVQGDEKQMAIVDKAITKAERELDRRWVLLNTGQLI